MVDSFDTVRAPLFSVNSMFTAVPIVLPLVSGSHSVVAVWNPSVNALGVVNEKALDQGP